VTDDVRSAIPGWMPVESIPLAEAVLCVNCECVTRARNGHCPVCESQSLVSLARLAGRRRESLHETRYDR